MIRGFFTSPLPGLLRRLVRSRSGLAMMEFALGAPLLMTASLWGVESANQAIMQMRINQIAVMLADNASRIGESSLLGATKIYESDLNDVLLGGQFQGGNAADLYENGRVILSSLEVVPETTGDQYIHWQRCKGKLEHQSSYGDEGDGAHGGFPGMGPEGAEIIAFPGEAVMFVEVAYEYQPLISTHFSSMSTIVATAAFNVRDNRDLSQIYQRDTSQPDPIMDCTTFDDFSSAPQRQHK